MRASAESTTRTEATEAAKPEAGGGSPPQASSRLGLRRSACCRRAWRRSSGDSSGARSPKARAEGLSVSHRGSGTPLMFEARTRRSRRRISRKKTQKESSFGLHLDSTKYKLQTGLGYSLSGDHFGKVATRAPFYLFIYFLILMGKCKGSKMQTTKRNCDKSLKLGLRKWHF